MITAWRIVATRFAADAFTGEGAFVNGGRWNSPGVRMVYTAGSTSLALLELLVHLRNTEALRAFSLCSVKFEERLVSSLDRATLPKDWRKSPAPVSLQALGDDWISSRASVVLRVPSAVVDDESNYLINPEHRDFRRLEISTPKPFDLDARLLS